MILDDASFVNYYELLDVELHAEAEALRRRICTLYLEARNNLEHQNHRKRFYFRELYEIHLPRARVILLDFEKRAAYNARLDEYFAEKGQPPTAPRRPTDEAKPKLDGLPESPLKSSPPSNGAHSSIEIAAIKHSAVQAPAAQLATAKLNGNHSVKTADDPLTIIEADIPLPPPVPVLRMDAHTVERRRNHKRRQLIDQESAANAWKWGFLGGSAALLAYVFVILILHALLPGGLFEALADWQLAFWLASGIMAISAATISAHRMMQWAHRQTVAYLSKLPYDALLRECGRGKISTRMNLKINA